MHKPSSGSRTSAGSAAAGMLIVLMLLGGCGKSSAPVAAPVADAAQAAPTAPAANAPIPPQSAQAMPPATGGGNLAARTGELSNPDNATMVYLYYDLAGITPPIDQWVEQDQRVRDAPGADKAAQRVAVKAAFEGGLAAVRGVGVIHLTAYAHLSQYDPTYGEFTIGALSPGSVYTFKAMSQTVTLKFNNALAAQTWSVPKDKAQAISDRYGNHQLDLDTTLKIEQVLPDPAGGTIVTHIVSWNLRDPGDGTTVARVKPGS
ncbi:MAG TPA: hypothetical protein VFW60_04150 [Rhodanobacteraceae bacterium]|nr:hypothetical protein [Rhodanobacteraceae bacterium]